MQRRKQGWKRLCRSGPVLLGLKDQSNLRSRVSTNCFRLAENLERTSLTMHGACTTGETGLLCRHYEHTKTSRPNHGQQQRLWPIDGGDTRAERIFRVCVHARSWREKCRRGGPNARTRGERIAGAGSLRDGRDEGGGREQVRVGC